MDEHVRHLNDFHLAQKCLAGDREALAWLDGHLGNVVTSYLVRLGATREEAQELSKGLLTELVAPIGERPPRLLRYSGDSSLDTWLHAVVLNKWISRKRQEDRWRKLLPVTLTPTDPESENEFEPGWAGDRSHAEPSDAPLLTLMREAIEEAFRSCSAESFVLLQLAHCDGLRTSELATMFGCAGSQISRRLSKAEKQIATATLHYVRLTDPWLELTWADFTELCRTATPACFGVD